MYDGRRNNGRPVIFSGGEVKSSYIVSIILYEKMQFNELHRITLFRKVLLRC